MTKAFPLSWEERGKESEGEAKKKGTEQFLRIETKRARRTTHLTKGARRNNKKNVLEIEPWIITSPKATAASGKDYRN